MSTLIFKTKKHYSEAEKGLAIIAAIFMLLILTALGAIAISVSTGDIQSSVALVGEKVALNATEKGVSRLVENFNPYNLDASEHQTYAADLNNDTHSRYQIGKPEKLEEGEGPECIQLAGHQQGMGMALYDADVRGINTKYNSSLDVRVGLGYGPVQCTP